MKSNRRAAAVSAAGLLFIAGCAGGGHSVGSAPPGGGGLGPSSLTNGAKVTLNITLAQKQALSGRRVSNKVRPAASSKRVPSFVSPSTTNVALSAVYNGSSVFSTTINLSQCTGAYGFYQCATNLPVGTYTLYTNLYDTNNNWLGTNLYQNPTAQTIYANGSAPYGNYLYVDVAGIAKFAFIPTITNCFDDQGSSAYAEVYLFDADVNQIVGPLANPLTGYVTAINGSGQGAIDLYAASIYGVASADHMTIYDTSLYVPFVYVSGLEGSVELYGWTNNMPALFGEGSNGLSGFQSGSATSPASTQITNGTYNVLAMITGSPQVALYAVEESVPAIIQCAPAYSYPALSYPTYFGSIIDSSLSNTELVAVDGQNVDLIGYATYGTFYVAGGAPQVAATVTSTYTLGSNESVVNLFTSPDVSGRFFVITNNSSNSGNGQADQFLATNGVTTYSGSYSFQFPATTSLRIAGTGANNIYALYYTNPSGSNLLYGVDRTNGNQYPTITAFTSGTIYELSPAGPGVDNIFFRGYDASVPGYELCVFDAQSGFSSNHCVNAGGLNTNAAALRYESFTTQIMSVEGLSIYGDPANVTPSSFTSATLYTGFPNLQQRFIPGEATPGFIGVYSTATSPYTTTFLQWTGSSWTSYGSIQWPNAWVVPIK